MRFIKRVIFQIFKQLKKWFLERRDHRITLEGIIFILITFFIGFAAINTSTNLLYLIMSMMLSFFILSGILSSSTLRRIEVKRLTVRHVSAKEEAPIQIEIKNSKKRTSSYSLRILDHLKTGELLGASYVMHIPGGARDTVSYSVQFPRRGVYELSRIRVVTRFPFGFFERSFSVKQEQEIIVYPQIIDVRPVLESSNMDIGEIETGRKGQGQSLYGLREYSPTDSARYIHWKVSARINKLMIREFEKEEKKKITLYLFNYIHGEASSELADNFEKAVIYAASIAKYLIDREFQIRLITGSGLVPFGMGLAHLYRILRALALIRLEDSSKENPKVAPSDAESMNMVIHYQAFSRSRQAPSSAIIIDVTRLRIKDKTVSAKDPKK